MAKMAAKPAIRAPNAKRSPGAQHGEDEPEEDDGDQTMNIVV